MGRWDHPVAVAKTQALTAKIWSDDESGVFDPSPRNYQPLILGHNVVLIEPLRINAETRRHEKTIQALPLIKLYSKLLKSQIDTQKLIRWGQEDKNSPAEPLSAFSLNARDPALSKHLVEKNLHHKKTIEQSDVLNTDKVKTTLTGPKQPIIDFIISSQFGQAQVCGMEIFVA